MSRIEEKFKHLKQQGQKAFVAFITAGDPDLATTTALVVELEKAGVDIIELGVPFSDPLADGPVIQQASQRALASGTNLTGILRLVQHIRVNSQVKIPIVLMTYYNLLLQYGLKKLAVSAARAGVDGFIIPDLPPEEADEIRRPMAKAGRDIIFLLAPTSTTDRVRMVARLSKGFIYYVSLTGITGPRAKLPPRINKDVRRIKQQTTRPVCVGFGISRPEQARELCRSADGIIMGSAIIRELEKNANRKDRVERTVKFVARFVRAVKINPKQ